MCTSLFRKKGVICLQIYVVMKSKSTKIFNKSNYYRNKLEYFIYHLNVFRDRHDIIQLDNEKYYLYSLIIKN